MPLYDISLPLDASLAVWPGDAPYTRTESQRIRDGATVNLSSIALSVHAGTHADAPYHALVDGATIETLSLTTFVGPALVVDVRDKDVIRVADLAGCDFSETPRLLLKTGAWTDHRQFPETVPVMDTEVIPFLGAQGVVLVGLDVPSVDPIDSKDLPNHHALAAHGIAILEALDLADVPPGRYELIALPMKLIGADGAPVRAILIGEPSE